VRARRKRKMRVMTVVIPRRNRDDGVEASVSIAERLGCGCLPMADASRL
jgi:hypothetical protein